MWRRAVSRSRLLSHWDSDLRGLTDDGVRERLRLAERSAADSLRRGMGRSPKAARLWRDNAAAALAELERRGLRP